MLVLVQAEPSQPAARPRILRLACWDADGVLGRKPETERFLSEHGVDICHLNVTHLEAGRALRFVNYVCHRTDRPTPGGGTAILVHKGTDRYAVPVSGLQYLEAGDPTSEARVGLPNEPTKKPN
jgi:hypothetical protein